MLDVCAGKYSNALKRLGSYFTRSRHFRGLLFAGTYLIMAAQLSMFDFVKIYFSRKDLKEQLMFHQSQTRKKNISLQLTTAAQREELTTRVDKRHKIKSRKRGSLLVYSLPNSAGMRPKHQNTVNEKPATKFSNELGIRLAESAEEGTKLYYQALKNCQAVNNTKNTVQIVCKPRGRPLMLGKKQMMMIQPTMAVYLDLHGNADLLFLLFLFFLLLFIYLFIYFCVPYPDVVFKISRDP